jgi:hypothetical protein
LEPQAFLLCLSAGAPLHALLAPGEGGIAVLLRSNASGQFKSTALAAALSIWGDPKAMKIAGVSTVKSHYHIFSCLRHLPIGWDDVALGIDELHRRLLEFAEGTPRQRLDITGKMLLSDAHWSTFLLTTSNITIRNKLATTRNATSGGTVRILELLAQAKKSRTAFDGGWLLTRYQHNYGHVGRSILAKLFSDPDIVAQAQQDLIEKTTARMMRLKWNNNQRLIARALTCAEAGGLLLQSILTELDIAQIIETVEAQLIETHTTPIATDYFNQYISENLSAIVMVGMPQTQPNLRAILARYEKTRNTFALSMSLLEWHRWAASLNMSVEELTANLTAQGFSLNHNTLNLTEGTGYPQLGETACIVIRTAEWKAEGATDKESATILPYPGKRRGRPLGFRTGSPEEPDDAPDTTPPPA